jgi:SMC interacting uncharacterized protein involved in chromosome segregation
MSTYTRFFADKGEDGMGDYSWYAGVNRYVCAVLSEMRDQIKTMEDTSIPKRHLSSLIEEAQTCVNRMEAALEDWGDIRRGRDIIKKMKEEHKKLKKEIKALRAKRDELKGTKDD